MAFSYGRNEIGFRETGSKTTVADNDIAKLMYYLHCLCTTIECNNDQEIQRFTDYKNWYRLSFDEQKQLFILCYTLSPDEFDDKILFQNATLCRDSANKFYEISEVRHQLVAVQSIVIAGQTRRVNKIMTYTNFWMKNYYLEPMQRQAQRFSREERRKRSGCVIC